MSGNAPVSLRLSDEKLEALLGDLESHGVERKASLAEREDIRKSICAFANDLPGHALPGVVFIGAHDDGSCANLELTDRRLRQVADLRGEGLIQPLPTMSVEKRVIKGCELIVLTVRPSDSPPVRLRGRTWIRTGPTLRTATREEELRLAERRRAADLPFDLQPLPSAALDDLDLDLFEREYLPNAVAPELLTENRRSIEDQLQAVRFLDRHAVPTVVGLLVVGQEPRAYVPGALVQFVRFDGTELTDAVKDQKEIDGPIPELLRRLDEVIESHNAVGLDLSGGSTAVRRPEYPFQALQQLVRNAVLHRDYESTHAPVRIYWFADRVEIHSPGGPYGQVTPENFGEPGITDYRNPHVAEAMKVLGFVEKFGIGIQVARRELEKNGNPPLEFNVQQNRVLAVVRRAS